MEMNVLNSHRNIFKFAVPKLPTNKFRIIERVNAHIFDGLFYALNYHFAVFSKMMHIKDTVEVATCCANYGCLSRLHFCSMSEICGCFGELGKRRPFLCSI